MIKETANHSTHDKGDIGALIVAADLINQGASVQMPVSHATPYDLLIKYAGKYYEVQVKYRAVRTKYRKGSACGRIEVKPRRHTGKSHGKYVENLWRTNKQFDILAIYCPDLPKGSDVAYLHVNQYDKSVALRTEPAKNNQTKDILMFKDYLSLDKAINNDPIMNKEIQDVTRFDRYNNEVCFKIKPFAIFSKLKGRNVKKFRVACNKLGIDKRVDTYKQATQAIDEWENSEVATNQFGASGGLSLPYPLEKLQNEDLTKH